MSYFDGILWGAHNHLPRCTAWIDRQAEFAGISVAVQRTRIVETGVVFALDGGRVATGQGEDDADENG